MPRAAVPQHHTSQKIAEAFAMILFVIILGIVAQKLGIYRLSDSAASAATLGGAFVIGLVAASSTCLAAVGGLLLSVSAGWAQAHPTASHWRRMQPMLLFNVGRLVGYFILGGMIGLVGTVVSPSVRATGVLMILVSLVMLWLGLRMLGLLPKALCSLPQHTAIGRRINGMGKNPGFFMPFVLGGLTFFLPCGFTQSMQLTALATGSFVGGGLLLLAFAFGTLPALLGISVMSSVFDSRKSVHFFRFAGAIAVVLGVLNLESGLLQTGFDAQGAFAKALPGGRIEMTVDPNVSIDADGNQIIKIGVSDQGYTPSVITINPGIPTWIYATAETALTGCANFLTAPAYNLSTPIRIGGNWLGPIKNPQQDFVITCSMGRLRADIRVRQG